MFWLTNLLIGLCFSFTMNYHSIYHSTFHKYCTGYCTGFYLLQSLNSVYIWDRLWFLSHKTQKIWEILVNLHQNKKINCIRNKLLNKLQKKLSGRFYHTSDVDEQIIKFKIFTDVHCMVCWDQNNVTFVSGNQNHQPTDGWIQNQPENRSKTLKSQADPTCVNFFHSNSYCYYCSVYGPHKPVRTPDSAWAWFWWDSRWCPGGFPPNLDQDISGLLESQWWCLVVSDAPIHSV